MDFVKKDMVIQKNKRPNIVLITVDSLRADHCSFLGYHRNTTPFLDSIKNESIVFTNFYANSIPTFFAFPVLMSGLKPFTYGYVLGIPAGIETLAEKLKRLGYYTCAFISNNYALYPEFGYARGFDVFEIFHEKVTIDHNKNKPRITQIRRFFKKLIPNYALNIIREINFKKKFKFTPIIPFGQELVDIVTKHIKDTYNSDKSIFCWIHFMDAHHTYTSGLSLYNEFSDAHIKVSDIKENLFYYCMAIRELNEVGKIPDRLLSKVDIQVIKDLYDASIKYVDQCIYALLENLQSLLPKNTIFVITSDHGEAFFEHGYGFHEVLGLHNELIRIPLILHIPENKSSVEVETTFDHKGLHFIIYEIARNKSIFDLLPSRDYTAIGEIPYGCGSPHFKIRDTYTPIGNYPIRAFVIKNHWKLIFDVGGGYCELFDLKNDSSEQYDLKEKFTTKVDELKKVYFRWVQQRKIERINLKRRNLVERLRKDRKVDHEI